MPIDLCAKEGVSQEDLYRGQASEALNEVVFQIASIAKVSSLTLQNRLLIATHAELPHGICCFCWMIGDAQIASASRSK